MRWLLLVTPVAVLGCRGPSGDAVGAGESDAAAISVSFELDRAAIAATDELTGTIHIAYHSPPRESAGDEAAWCSMLTWRVEFADEAAPLLEVVIEGEGDPMYEREILPADRVEDHRCRIVPCEAFEARSRASAVPLRLLDPGNHALRIVVDAQDPGAWIMAGMGAPGVTRLVPLEGSFTSRWSTFDVHDAGRPLDADDVEAIVDTAEDARAAAILEYGCAHLGASERMVAIAANSRGFRRGRLAEVLVRHLHRGEWQTDAGWPAFRALFTEIDESGIDCTSHDSPPFFARFAIGRKEPIRVRSSQFCNFKVLCVYDEGVNSNFVLNTKDRTIDAHDLVTARGLFRVMNDVEPRIWGWLLVE